MKRQPSMCPGCDLPMIDGQVFNGLYGCHWDCTEKVRAQEGYYKGDPDTPKAQAIIDQRRVSDTEKARQVLGLVVDRVDAQFAKLEDLVAQLSEDPPHPVYSCQVESKDQIVCYDTKGVEGKPGFAICAQNGKHAQSVVLSVEDSKALSDQLVSFLVGQMPAPVDSFVDVNDRYESLDLCPDIGGNLFVSAGDGVRLTRESVQALRDRLNQFLEDTK